MVFRKRKPYTAPNAEDEDIMNKHLYRDVFEEPKPAEKRQTRDEYSDHHTEELLEDDWPLATLKRKNKP